MTSTVTLRHTVKLLSVDILSGRFVILYVILLSSVALFNVLQKGIHLVLHANVSLCLG